jgi:hypothetical protein
MLATTCLLLITTLPQDPAPGIDRELARERKQLVSDIHYDLRFRLQFGQKEERSRCRWCRAAEASRVAGG